MPLIDCNSVVDSIIAESTKGGRLAILYDRNRRDSHSYVLALRQCARRFDVFLAEQSIYNANRDHNWTRGCIHAWNNDTDINSILFVSPSPSHCRIVQQILSEKNVEGTDFHDDPSQVSCTARACVKIIESITSLEGKRVVIVGYGKVVGKPLAYLLMRKHVDSVLTTHQYTDNQRLISEYIPNADVIISAVGKPNFLNCKVVDKIFIDAGISIDKGKIVGDVHPDVNNNNFVTPVPGGVGPVTVALLMQNVTLAHQKSLT